MPATKPLNIISLGAGVQSSTMALMAAHGEIEPMPDCAIFADTQSEPAHIYDFLDFLETKLPFPVHRVTAGSIHDDILEAVKKRNSRLDQPPFFLSGGGMLWRECTKNYKIIPIEREVRRLLGVEKGKHVPKGTMVEQWIGISCDEAVRMKPSRHKWCRHRWPLIEKEMRRHHCLDWLRRNRYPIAKKSACTFCPYHDDATWRDMKINDIGSFEAAVEIDEAIRQGVGMSKQRRELFLHRSGRPLKDVDFSSLEDLGQLNMFNNECEGMCGV